MKIDFDPNKDATNITKHGVSLAVAKEFEYDTAIRVEDIRKDYGEQRIVAYGYLGTRLHVLCYKPVSRLHIRVISLRKANKRERMFYDKTLQTISG